MTGQRPERGPTTGTGPRNLEEEEPINAQVNKHNKRKHTHIECYDYGPYVARRRPRTVTCGRIIDSGKWPAQMVLVHLVLAQGWMEQVWPATRRTNHKTGRRKPRALYTD